ncbi:hypothetical protein G5C51_02020 [Streptomyces sp. A7024]|uniref:Uncharacterized protein n=1 Tax=Streptomyces coryli TaxID=1128680 RepID=A0A6G4TUA3_9ACTN|nr:DUF6578 domain-containing protein [Streptomyces coryli]NGN62678.1 hypothetical protein [Streptomyces coryli]
MEMTVWMDAWQLQCCGTPFSIGDEVTWTLGDADMDWLAEPLGPATTAEIDAAEEHHGGLPSRTPTTTGTVTSIHAVHCRYAPEPGADDRTLSPVKDSAILTTTTTADGWESAQEDRTFIGYLIHLDTPPHRA